MKCKILFICLLLFVVGGSLKAQDDQIAERDDNDFGVWSSIEVEKKINKFSINGEAEMRTQYDSKEIARWGVKLGADYSIIKGVKVGAAYQFLYFHDTKYWDFQPRHRFISYAQGKWKLSRFSFTLRERFQSTLKDDTDRIGKFNKRDKYKVNPEWTWRNRVKVEYNIPKCPFTPSFSMETFYQLNNPKGNEFDGLRYTLALEYKINKKQQIELGGIYDREVNVKSPVQKYVLNVCYSYSF